MQKNGDSKLCVSTGATMIIKSYIFPKTLPFTPAIYYT